MQTSLSRRQRRRRLNDKRRPRGSGAAKYVAVALPLILFTTIALLGLAGATGAVAGYSYLARDLPDPQEALESINYDQQTGVYDRTGEVLLARLGSDRRELVTFDQIPAELVDATTAIEDDSFWSNPGFDLGSFLQATWDTLQGNERGGSTITQQLVRNRLLLPSDVEPGADKYQRKLREIIQSIRLTEAYPGEDGKKLIIQSYLNNNYYGNRSYGVAAAAQSYWSKGLSDLSLAQYAILAGIPKSPSAYDLVQNAVEEDCTGADGKTTTCLVVPPTTAVVQRRNEILEFMKTRSPLSGKAYTAADYEAAKAEPVVLASQATAAWRAPHFVWKVRDELGQLLCGENQCEKIDTGGYTVITSLDYRMQRIVEKWVYAAAIIPNSNNQNQLLKNRQIPRGEWDWIKGLSGHNLHNAAAGVIDYRTGEVLAYAGSASYTAKGSKKMQPQFDVLGDGWRQPGSAFKPLVYAIGIDDGTLTAATMFMDVVTNFAPAGAKPFTPTQADRAERGPVLLRSALQFSLNVPAVKAGFLNGLDHQFQRTKDFGIRYLGSAVAVPSMSIGTLEVHPDRPHQRVRRHRRRGGADAPPHHREGARRHGRPGLAAGGPQGRGRARGQSPGGLHRHRHPGRQHAQRCQPVLGPLEGDRRGDEQHLPSGRVQDGYHHRQQGRARRRVPRPTVGQGPACAGGRGLDGQLRQHAQRRQALARHVGTAVVRDPVRRLEGDEDRGLRPDEAEGPGHGRPSTRSPA